MGAITVFVAGSGGIGSAVGILMRQFWDKEVNLLLGDIDKAAADNACDWIKRGAAAPGTVTSVTMTDGWQTNLTEADLLLDCLPGRFAPEMAAVALQYGLHYVNLTEYVAETKQIVEMAEKAETGFALQSGLAPGFVNVLGNQLFHDFCEQFGVQSAERLEMRVGALTKNAVSPHFYGFTWSPIGVATEYVKDAEVVRNHQLINVPSLSERRPLLIDGRPYEEELTSGGAADIPIALASKIRNIDYKTLRYPGHYAWVDGILQTVPQGRETISYLEEEMLRHVPSVEDDEVIVYCAVEGLDSYGRLRRIDEALRVLPIQIGDVTLRAIQSTTAAGMAEAARLIVENQHRGVLFQSQIDSAEFLNGPFVKPVYYGQE